MCLKKFKQAIIAILLTVIIPQITYAYSSRIIASGKNIGITLNAKGVLIVGTYSINETSPAIEAGLKSGDNIIKINGNQIDSIENLAEQINNNEKVNISYLRNNKEYKTTLKLYKDKNGVYKTGLYIKDSITGIGTLTFIDPNTKIFGALGHEIQEQSTGKIFEIKDGKIFDSKVTGVIPSTNGNPGEKKAEYDKNNKTGDVKENTTQGIFGKYIKNMDKNKTYKVAKPNEIKIGKAKILTVLNNDEVKEYEIKITNINNNNSKNKNFVFEITDQELLNKTGGIIQGMSGSPIIQEESIIGAVTHVIVDNPHKGYGIFITNMLEEAEK